MQKISELKEFISNCIKETDRFISQEYADGIAEKFLSVLLQDKNMVIIDRAQITKFNNQLVDINRRFQLLGAKYTQLQGENEKLKLQLRKFINDSI